MPFRRVYQYKALKAHLKAGRSAAIEARGSMIPFHSRRGPLQGVVRELMPKQKYDAEARAADEQIGQTPSQVQKRKRKRELEGRGSGAANTDPTVHNQPRFSGDKLAQFRKAARGAG